MAVDWESVFWMFLSVVPHLCLTGEIQWLQFIGIHVGGWLGVAGSSLGFDVKDFFCVCVWHVRLLCTYLCRPIMPILVKSLAIGTI